MTIRRCLYPLRQNTPRDCGSTINDRFFASRAVWWTRVRSLSFCAPTVNWKKQRTPTWAPRSRAFPPALWHRQTSNKHAGQGRWQGEAAEGAEEGVSIRLFC